MSDLGNRGFAVAGALIYIVGAAGDGFGGAPDAAAAAAGSRDGAGRRLLSGRYPRWWPRWRQTYAARVRYPPKRHHQATARRWPQALRRAVAGWRQIVERVHDWLLYRFGLEHERPLPWTAFARAWWRGWRGWRGWRCTIAFAGAIGTSDAPSSPSPICSTGNPISHHVLKAENLSHRHLAPAAPSRATAAEGALLYAVAMESQSLLLMGPRRLAWVAEELPPLAPDAVLVRTTVGAVSVGTELPQYTSAERVSAPRDYPRMTGYESVRVVVACGDAVQGLHTGERVVAFYGHRTLAAVSASKVILIPDGVSDALALLAILTCDVAKGIRKLTPRADEPTLVTGAGAIGLLTLWVLRAYGVRVVDVVEPVAERRALALRLGAREAWSPEDAPGDANYTVGFECSSRDAAFHLLQRRVAAGGRICVLADGNIEPLTLAPDFHRKELTVVGSSDGWDYQEHARWYFARVQAGAPELEAIFDERVAASELPVAFARMADGERVPVKVLIDYNTG